MTEQILCSSSEARYELRRQLLIETLSRASKCSRFYANLWGERSVNVKCPEDLPLLPIIDKQDVSEHLNDILCDSEFPALIQHTTGTTGIPVYICRSAEEIRFIQRFFVQTIDPNNKELPPVILDLADLYHGPSLEIPARAHPVRAGMTDDILLKEAVRILTTEHAVPGGKAKVSTIIGLVPYIKTLTNYLIEIGFEFSNSSVNIICPLCTIVTPRWRKLLSSVWGAMVVDRYSLTEIFGGATRCLTCGNFHFDPVVIPEVVDISSRETIDSGVGVLVLTSLYPFVQLQPMVRYWTGDLVEISANSCQPDLSVQFKGRVSSTPLWKREEKSEIVICPVDVYEVLDDLPDVNFSERFIDISLIRDHSAAGSLRFRLLMEEKDSLPLLHLEIELRYSPHLYEDRCAFIREHITAELFKRSPVLFSRKVGLVIDFFQPETIPPFSLKI